MSIRKYRRGDVVSVRALVQHSVEDGDTYVHVKVGGTTRAAVDLDQVISFIQPAVELDEVVWRTFNHDTRGTVKAIAESAGLTFLMVETAPGQVETWLASHVEVVPPPPPAKND